MQSVRPRRQFRWHPWLSLLAISVAIGTAILSRWQFDRAGQKAHLQAQFEAQQQAPARTQLTPINLDTDRFARVAIPGAFIAGKSFLHDNQIQAGRAGAHVYAAFAPADGSPPVLVNRGWQPLIGERTRAAAPAIPAAQFTLMGRVNVPAQRTQRLAAGADTPALVQTIELVPLRQALQIPLAPFIIEQTAMAGVGDSLIRAWISPDFKITTHRMYAGQWACFSALTIVLWLVLSFRKSSP